MPLCGSELVYHPHTVEVIGDKKPSANDLAENEQLEKFLRDNRLFESPEEYTNRVEVLNLLLDLVRKWVKLVARRRGMSEAEVEDANANFYSFGSFRLNSHGPGDDIDTHCVGPQWCDRKEDFFGQNDWCLEKLLASQPWVDSIQAVPDAYVPVLKLLVREVDIDLTYAQLPLNEVPEDLDLQNNNLMRGMDETSVTSINGCRVTDKIVKLVQGGDEKKDLAPFQNALRYLKYWGKRRGIYSNVMGFLGGVNFAILMARVCLHFPNACASMLVRHFFRVMYNWSWGELPFQITGIHRGGPWGSKVWEKKRTASWDPVKNIPLYINEVFPILTPCYPASNSTFNVSECTKAIMLAEFKRGADMVAERKIKHAQYLDFEELSEPCTFFAPGSFKTYLQITAAASSREDFATWKGFIQAQVKRLVSRIHSSQGLSARPWPKEFPIPIEHCEDGRLRTCWIVGLKVMHASQQNNQPRRVDFRNVISEWQTKVMSHHLHQPGMTVEFAQLVSGKLPVWLESCVAQEVDDLKGIAERVKARKVEAQKAAEATAQAARAAEAQKAQEEATKATEAAKAEQKNVAPDAASAPDKGPAGGHVDPVASEAKTGPQCKAHGKAPDANGEATTEPSGTSAVDIVDDIAKQLAMEVPIGDEAVHASNGVLDRKRERQDDGIADGDSAAISAKRRQP